MEAIKQAQAQKVAEAMKVEEAHGEALGEDKAREAISEAQIEASKEDALRTGLKLLEGEFAGAEKEAQDAQSAIAEAQKMLADSSLDPETKEAIKAIVEEGQQKISEFAILNSQYRQLAYEVAVLNKNPAEDKVLELQSSGAEIKFLGSDGKPEDGWEITGIGTGKVFIANSQTKSEKAVPVSEFLSWQGGETSEVAMPVAASTIEGAPATAKSPESSQRDELVEGVREERAEKMAEEKKLTESWQGMVFAEDGQEMSIEEAKAKGGIGKLDIINGSKNRSNINALLEAGLLTPEDVMGQISELANKSPDQCQDILLGFPGEVIGKLKLNDRKYEELVGNLVKQDMEHVDARGQDNIRALGFLRLPKMYELNAPGAALGGFDANFMQGGKWQAIKDAIVASYDDGPEKGNLLIGTAKGLPELMFDAVKIKWLDREQIMKWLKDSNEKWRGSANEKTTISKILELQDKGYITQEESKALLG